MTSEPFSTFVDIAADAFTSSEPNTWRPPRHTDSHGDERDLPLRDDPDNFTELEGRLQLAETARNELTKHSLTKDNLEVFGSKIINACAYSPEFFALVVRVINHDAATGKIEHNDFIPLVDGMAFAAMQAAYLTSSPGTPWPTSGPQWRQHCKPHLDLLFEKTPDLPRGLIDEAVNRFESLAPHEGGDLDLLCDGLMDYILGIRTYQHEMASSRWHPAQKADAYQTMVASIVKSGSSGLTFLQDLDGVVGLPEIVEDLILAGTSCMLYGPPNLGKTFFAADLAAAIADAAVKPGRKWAGRHVQPGGVLYYCLEGARGFNNRIQALSRDGRLDGNAPLAFNFNVLNLLDGGVTQKIIADLRQAERKFGRAVTLVVIDTLPAAMAGGDECTSTDMGKALDAIQQVINSTGAAVLSLHHPGKDVSRGPRGWSGVTGNLDTIVELQLSNGSEVVSAVIKKQKDLPYCAAMNFKLRVVRLGINDRGKPITSCVVDHKSSEEAAAENVELMSKELQMLWAQQGTDISITLKQAKVLMGTKKDKQATDRMAALVVTDLVLELPRGACNQRSWNLTEKGRTVLSQATAPSDTP